MGVVYMISDDTEFYFRPEPMQTIATTVMARLFNQCRLLLGRVDNDCVFVPIRDLQFQSVVTQEEVIFIYAHGGYALDRNGEGGRLINIAWRWDSLARDSLTEPVPMHVTFYGNNLEEIQRRLLSSFPAAVQSKLDVMTRNKGALPDSCKILSFQPSEKI